MDFKATGRPKWSAITPSMVTPIPPVPIAKPAMRPEAMPRFLGRELLRHDHGDCKTGNQCHADGSEADEQHETMRHEDQRDIGLLVRAIDRIKYSLCPHRSARGEPTKVPTAPPARKTETNVPA